MHGPLQVPGFTIGRRLGDHTSSNWHAIHDATGAPVTLRVVSGPAMVVRSRLLSAIDVLRELDHPHVLGYRDMIERDEDIIVVLDAAEGGSMSDILRARGTLPPGELVTGCAPIAEGLAEMHHHGIVHGAVTADDIVFAADGRPMLAGVGLGVLGVWPNPGAAPSAPETVAGTPAEPPADVYALAHVACVALSGYQPREPLSIVGVPGPILGVLSRCLLRTPDHRPEIAALANAIYGIADPEPIDLVPEEVEATATFSRLSEESVPEAGHDDDAGTGQDVGDGTDVGSESDVESFMRGGRRSRRTPREPAEPHDPAAPHDPVTPQHPGVPGAGAANPASGAQAGDPDSTATRPIDTPGPPAGSSPGTAGVAASGPEERTPADISTQRGGSRVGSQGVEQPDTAPSTDGDDDRGSNVADTDRDDAGEGRSRRRRGPASGDSAKGSGRRSGATPPTGGSLLDRIRGGLDPAKIAVVAVVVLLIVATVIVVQQVTGDDELPEAGNPANGATAEPTDFCGGPQPAPDEAPPAVTDWSQEVQRLYDLRAQAFTELDATLLCEVYAPTSESLARDVETLQQYADSDVHPEGLAFDVIDVALIEENGGEVTVEVSDQITEHDLIDEGGGVIETIPAVAAETWQADLVAVVGPDGGAPTWRFS